MVYDKNVFINNKYYRVYEKLVNKRLQTPYKGEGEKHHYIPKSIIPNNDLVFLSYREHYVAHLLLVKAVNTNYKEKMLYAITAMKIRTLSNTSFNSHLFDALKIKANINRSISRTGVARSEETKNKLRIANLGKKVTEEIKAKMRDSHKLRISNMTEKELEAHREFLSQRAIKRNTGRKHSDSAKSNMSIGQMKAPRKECLYCGITTNIGNYNRWHGIKCKKFSGVE